VDEPVISRKVLLADDSELGFELVDSALRSRGHYVDWARNGAEALARIQNRRYDLLLLDLHMPRMDGFQVAAAIREDASVSDLRIVVLTADNMPGVREELLAVGVREYVTKPFNVDYLIELVERPEASPIPVLGAVEAT
jgi:chemosensory pili system protein ChpA (sensor histidine kinase/response regulator)